MLRTPGKSGLVILAAVVFAVMLLSVLVIKWPLPGEEDAKQHSRKIHLRYSFTLQNRSNELVENIHFQTFAPVKVTPFQQVERITTSHDHELRVDAVGNQQLHFAISHLPPYGQTEITVSVEVNVHDGPAKTQLWRQGDFLAVEPFIEHDHAIVASAVERISRSNGGANQDRWMAAAHNWVASTIKDAGYIAEDRGAVYALQERTGDCTEFMYALVAMARANQIPAVPLAGFRIQGQSAVIRSADYHNWLLFNTGDQWGISDPHGNVFNQAQQEYIVFQVLQPGLRQDRKDSAQRFFVYDDRIVGSMN